MTPGGPPGAARGPRWLSGRPRQHPQHRDGLDGGSGRVVGQRAGQRGVGHLVHPQRPHQRVPADSLDERAAAEDDASLRPAEQLVAAHAQDVHTGASCCPGRSARPAGTAAATAAPPAPRRRLPRRRSSRRSGFRCRGPRRPGTLWRRPTATSSSSAGCSVKPSIVKFERCTRRMSAVRSRDGRLVVGGARAVRRAHLAQDRARLRHHVGHAEPAADLHQFAARDDHLAAGPERRQHQHRRGRVVVDDGGGLGAGQPAEQRLGVAVAMARGRPPPGRTRASSSRGRRPRPGPAPTARAGRARDWCG